MQRRLPGVSQRRLDVARGGGLPWRDDVWRAGEHVKQACSAIAIAVFVLAAAHAAHAQTVPASPTEVTESGRATFLAHCAPCHGRDAKGRGPVAPALTTAPPDLTTLATRNGGRFARGRLSSYVLGRRRPPAAHGTSEMPVWGPLFRALNPSESQIDIRLERLLDHLESLQVRTR